MIAARGLFEGFVNLGGMGLTAQRHGFIPTISTDISNEAQTAFNHLSGIKRLPGSGRPQEVFIQDDIRNLSAELIQSMLKKHFGIDIMKSRLGAMVGGPPCFKATQLNGVDRSVFHPMNMLMLTFVNLIRNVGPLTAWIEQVPGFISNPMAPLRRLFFAALDRMDEYLWEAEVLDASWYGGYQRRRRLTVVLVHKDLGVKPSFPEPSQPDLSVQSAFNTIGAEQFVSRQYKAKPVNGRIQPFNTLTSGGYDIYTKGRWKPMTIEHRLKISHMEDYDLLSVFPPSVLQKLLAMMVVPTFGDAMMGELAAILKAGGADGW